jgi:hypothetical protein
MRLVLLIPFVAALAACAQTPAETAAALKATAATQMALDKELAGLVPGKPMSCISQFGSLQVKGYGSTIVYRASDNLKYRSDTAGGCGRVGNGDVLVTRSYSGQLCAGDIAQTIDPVARFPTGSCSFAQFVPYRKPS